MELVIGKDVETSKLKVVAGSQVKLLGEPASVPDDVSRQHCKLVFIDENTLVITNLKAYNSTWVNGIGVQSMGISVNDRVELGPSHYLLPLAEIVKMCRPNIADIRPLKKINEDYNQKLINIRKRQQRNNLIARVPMVFTMLGGLIAAITSQNRNQVVMWVTISLTFIALIIMVYGFILIGADKSVEKQEELKKWYQRTYICPKCGHFMGFQDYDVLAQGNNCPYCKAKYRK